MSNGNGRAAGIKKKNNREMFYSLKQKLNRFVFFYFVSSDLSHILGVRRCGHILFVHEIRSPIHLCAVHNHSNGAR